MSTFGGVYAGSYYGGGYSGGSYGNKVASSSNNSRVIRDMVSNYDTQFDSMQSYFANGDTRKGKDLYESMYSRIQETASQYGYTYDDAQICQILAQSYQKATGESINQAIKNTDGSFLTGFKQGIPFFGLFSDSVSEEEFASEVLREELYATDQAKEYLGAATGGIVGATGMCTAAYGVTKLAATGAGQTAVKAITDFAAKSKIGTCLLKLAKGAVKWAAKHPVGLALTAAAAAVGYVAYKNCKENN